MHRYFPSEGSCFMNKNYRLLEKYSKGKMILNKQEATAMLKEIRFGKYSQFFQLYYKAQNTGGTAALAKSFSEIRDVA